MESKEREIQSIQASKNVKTLPKCQLILKRLFASSNSSKKRTNEFGVGQKSQKFLVGILGETR